MVFGGASAAGVFCRDSPFEMFVVLFVPVAGDPAGATAPAAAQPAVDLRAGDSLAAELRAMGLM